jgi:hypothetical protein
MAGWRTRLQFDPIVPLLASDNEAIAYFTCRDLLGQETGPVSLVWNLPEVKNILLKQQPDGSWGYPGRTHPDSGVKYSLIETWKMLRYLVDMYEMDRTHPAIGRAAGYVFSCQTDEGDIRGILANQYAPYYTGALMSLLIKAGYAEDPRIERVFRWLQEMRQDDGGWVIGSPGMVGLGHLSAKEQLDLTSNPARETAQAFDRTKPFSAAGTGMVIRAFAAHPQYRKSEYAWTAARLLKSKLFQEDNWSSYRHPDNWVRFQYPFWWTNIVSALDSLSLIGMTADDRDVGNALQWLINSQQEIGLWKASYSGIHRNAENSRTEGAQLWITLAICRIMKRLLPR